ncbi:hypothetical protein AC578_4152 [Pseudocercospora eumusae]|uniref:Uncharacterized protein n=1 Tax=Pseudocercospora eumusae TaxID=321146 RepID=A0A139GWG6_9PEZI|nr:hypothetical protein AC578_4152 [Pseudocercospora eumusae]
MANTYGYTTTIKADPPAQPRSKRFSLLRNKNDSSGSGTKAPNKLHLELQKSLDNAKKAFKKAASLTPGHEQRVTRRENVRGVLIDTMVLKTTLRDEKKKLRATEKIAEDVTAELEAVKKARSALQADLEQEKNLSTIQKENLDELKIQNIMHRLRLDLEMKSSETWKAADSKQINDLQNANEQLTKDYEAKLDHKKAEIAELQCELFELQQNVEVVGSKLEAAELKAAEQIETLENTIKQVELTAEQHLTSEKDKFERENSALAWEVNQAQKSFVNERAHVNGLHNELAFVEAENLNIGNENIHLRAERDHLHEKLDFVANELKHAKKAISYAVERMYIDNPLVKKDPDTTPLSEALQDHIEISNKKVDAARIYQARAEKEVASEKTKYRQLVDKTAEQRKEWLAMKKEIGGCKGARKQAEYDLVQQGHKLEAVNARNQELEKELEDAKKTSQSIKEKGEQAEHDLIQRGHKLEAADARNQELQKRLEEVKQISQAFEEKNKELEKNVAEATEIAEAATQNANRRDSVTHDNEAKISELEKRCARLKQEKAELQDEQETEECITADKISNLERELADTKDQLEEYQVALKNANTFLDEADQQKAHMHDKVLDSITRADKAIQFQTQAEMAYDEVYEEKKMLERQIDSEQATFEAELSRLKQTFEAMHQDMRSALEDLEDGIMSGEKNTILEAVMDLRDILGSRDVVDESLEESMTEREAEQADKSLVIEEEEGEEYSGLSTIEEETEEEVAAQVEELEPLCGSSTDAAADVASHEGAGVTAEEDGDDEEEVVLDEVE